MSKHTYLICLINQLVKDEDREPGEKDMILKVLKKLTHALDVKNIKEIRDSIDNLSERLIK